MPRADYRFCPVCGAALTRREIEERSRQACLRCGWIHYENPLPCAGALVRDGEGRILLVQRGAEPGRGKWALPPIAFPSHVEIIEEGLREAVR